MVEEGRVYKNDGLYKLTELESKRIVDLNSELQTKELQRFANFSNFLDHELALTISNTNKKILWKEFLAYLYNCFYQHGYDALTTLNPRITNGNGDSFYIGVLKKSTSNLNLTNPTLVDSFLQIVNRFADFVSNQDIEFLHDLAQKTSSFSSLGIAPELAEVDLNHKLVDWVLYLDTNVLYSLLSLRYHPENEACMALIQLLQDNKDYISVKLRYSSITLKELKTVKENFEDIDNSLTNAAVRAMLKSGRLNPFMVKFYEGLLEIRETTLHPNKIVDLAGVTLRNRTIEIGQNDARLKKIGEEIIDAQVTEYYKFLEDRNKVKEEFFDSKGMTFTATTKGEKQVRHDVALREIILDSRKLKPGDIPTLNSLKYFGLTLDENLMHFDKKMTKDTMSENSFPVFFRPSFLLNRLTKFLPIKTINYKQAFIKAVTSKAYFKNTSHSSDVIQIVTYLKSQGIDNDNLIYNIISQDIILDRYSKNKNKGDFNKGEFISSEINDQMTQVENELKITKDRVDSITSESEKSRKEKDIALTQSQEFSELLSHFQQASKTLTKRVRLLESKDNSQLQQTKIDFVKDGEISNLRQNLLDLRTIENKRKVEDYKKLKLKKWRYSLWYNLIWVVPVMTTSGLIIFTSNNFPLNYVMDNPEEYSGMIVSILTFTVTGIFVKLVDTRYWSPNAKKAFLDGVVLPDEPN